MATERTLIDMQAFQDFIARPENDERFYELIHGQIVKKPMPTEYHGQIVAILLGLLYAYTSQHPERKLKIGTEVRFKPDDANSRLPDVHVRYREGPAQRRGAVSQLPQLIAEVKSPDDSYTQMRDSATYYMTNGTQLVWLIYPEKQLVEVYAAGQDADLLTASDTLTGGPVLPGFSVPVSTLFED